MGRSSKRVAERSAAIAIAMVVLITEPMISLFDAGPQHTVLGIPLLFFHLFTVWSLAVLLVAVVMERTAMRAGDDDDEEQVWPEQGE